MTIKPAKLAYRLGPPIDYSKLSFDPDDPEPLPDGMFQYPVFEEILHVLGVHLDTLHPPGNVFRSSNTFICYDPADLNVRVGPDFYAALGVDAPAIEKRKMYLPWEAGKPPDFVLEVGSESTARHDVTGKRDIYARIGVAEYWRFDRSGGELYGEPLAGDFLEGGTYRPAEMTTEPDGVLKGYSPALRLSLCWRAGDGGVDVGSDGMLAFYDPTTGEYLRNLRGERAAREAAEARVRQLEEELRGRQGG